jgi:hypothetical protein
VKRLRGGQRLLDLPQEAQGERLAGRDLGRPGVQPQQRDPGRDGRIQPDDR